MALAWVSLLTLVIGGIAAKAYGPPSSSVLVAIMANAVLFVAIIQAAFVALHPYKN
jgi:hypothetical protein